MRRGKHISAAVAESPYMVLAPTLALVLVTAVAFVPPYIDAKLSVEGEDADRPEADPALVTIDLDEIEQRHTAQAEGSNEDADGEAESGEDADGEAEKSAPPAQAQIDLPCVNQLPELRCGCEISAATSLLNYLGFSVAATEMNGHLAQGWGNSNPHEQFIGYCATSGWMCYAEPIAAACNAYLEEIGASGKYVAEDLTGASAEDLYSGYIAKGTPVCVWVTTYLQGRSVADAWYVGEEYVTVSEQDHCMALCGYTPDTVSLMDPLQGQIVEYSRSAFEASYEVRGFRAVAIISR